MSLDARIRCGTDIVEVDRIERALTSASGGRFLSKVFTETERLYCEARKSGRFESYAARFSAKEAFLKALGVGLFAGAALTEIEIVNDARTGAPSLNLRGGAAALYESLGGFSRSVSLSHTRRHATATVVLLCGCEIAGQARNDGAIFTSDDASAREHIPAMTADV